MTLYTCLMSDGERRSVMFIACNLTGVQRISRSLALHLEGTNKGWLLLEVGRIGWDVTVGLVTRKGAFMWIGSSGHLPCFRMEIKECE